MADEASSRTVEIRLDGAVKEYSIEPLEKADALKLLDHELGIVKVSMSITFSETMKYATYFCCWLARDELSYLLACAAVFEGTRQLEHDCTAVSNAKCCIRTT